MKFCLCFVSLQILFQHKMSCSKRQHFEFYCTTNKRLCVLNNECIFIVPLIFFSNVTSGLFIHQTCYMYVTLKEGVYYLFKILNNKHETIVWWIKNVRNLWKLDKHRIAMLLKKKKLYPKVYGYRLFLFYHMCSIFDFYFFLNMEM